MHQGWPFFLEVNMEVSLILCGNSAFLEEWRASKLCQEPFDLHLQRIRDGS
jgi:hypothetical protein